MDSDGDRVLDGLDKCPNTPRGATVDSSGCSSDADGDGVPEGVDQCANTPKGALVDSVGCPIDSDGDGVPDGIDLAVGTPLGALVDSLGRPLDGDADGVFDGLDKCPNTLPGLKVDSLGCSIEIVERETELLDTGLIRLNDVNFETGKATLLPESHAELQVVAGLLLKWPELRLEVGGHTDSRGSAAKNQALSQARADTVRAWVLANYPNVDPNSLTTKGYGATKPRAPNTSELGRAKNRRVELVVINKESLKKVSERRRELGIETAAPADTTKK
jgi:outer membrane protein OmpA-like peptidoglycan-associated protein